MVEHPGRACADRLPARPRRRPPGRLRPRDREPDRCEPDEDVPGTADPDREDPGVQAAHQARRAPELYRFSPSDYLELAAVFNGPHPETGEELEVVDEAPEGVPAYDLRRSRPCSRPTTRPRRSPRSRRSSASRPGSRRSRPAKSRTATSVREAARHQAQGDSNSQEVGRDLSAEGRDDGPRH